jgi:hypothetical protein
MEYCLLFVQEPILYVIRKQQRHSQNHETPISDYYIIAGIVYQVNKSKAGHYLLLDRLYAPNDILKVNGTKNVSQNYVKINLILTIVTNTVTIWKLDHLLFEFPFSEPNFCPFFEWLKQDG